MQTPTVPVSLNVGGNPVPVSLIPTLEVQDTQGLTVGAGEYVELVPGEESEASTISIKGTNIVSIMVVGLNEAGETVINVSY